MELRALLQLLAPAFLLEIDLVEAICCSQQKGGTLQGPDTGLPYREEWRWRGFAQASVDLCGGEGRNYMEYWE